MMNNDMSTSTRRKVNKEWGIEEERYSRTAPGFTKRKLRKRDTLPIIFVIVMLAVLAIGGWRSSARASGEAVLGIDLAGSFLTDDSGGLYDEITFGDTISHAASLYVYDGSEAHAEPVGYTGTITYSSSNTEVATIAADGTISVLKPGTTVITITAPGVQDQFIGCTSSYRLIVDPIPVTISDIVINKTYDRTTAASIPTKTITYGDSSEIDVLDITINGVLPADSDYVYVLPNVTVAYPNMTVGANIVLTASSFVLSGAKANFYELTAQPTVTGTISPKVLTISSGIVTDDKVYDGTDEAILYLSDNSILTSQLIPGDTVTFSGTGSFDDANASDSPKTVSFTRSNLNLVGADGNYVIGTLGQTETTATISKKDITVSGIKALDKAFDNTTTADLVYTNAVLAGKLQDDTLTVTATGTFADKNIGAGKTVNITGITLAGASAGNYKLAAAGQQTTTTATIFSSGVAPTVTIEGEYTYKGAAITPTYTVKIDDNVLKAGTDYTATLSNNINAGTTAKLTIKAVDGGIYRFADEDVYFTIKKAPASVVSVEYKNSLTYNKTEQTQEVKTVSVGSVPLDSSKWQIQGTSNKSTDAGNHNIVINISGDANVEDGSVTKVFTIAQKEVTVSGITAESKPYDGTKNAVLKYTGATFSGKLEGDELSVAEAKGEFTSKNAGTGITVDISDIKLGGNSAANYKVSSASQSSTTAAITKVEVTPSVSVSGTYVYTGKAIKPTDVTVTVSGETLEKTDYSITGYEDNINAGTATLYVSSKSTGNYSFSSVGGTFTIQKATSLSPSPKTTLTLKSSSTATKVGDISVTSLSVNASKWAWRSSDEGISLVGEGSTASTGTSTKTSTQPVTVKATLEYIGDDAANYADSVKTVVVTITKEGSTSTTKGTTGTGSTGTRSTSTSTKTGTTGTSSRSSTTSSRTSGSSTGTSSRSSSSSGSTSSRTGSSSRTSSGSASGSGSGSAAASEAKPPFIEGAPDISGWEAILTRIAGTALGDSIPVYMNGSSVVPADVLNSFKDRNVTLVLDMGNSIKWNINGACISQDISDDIDFSITTNTKTIPSDLIDLVSTTDYKMQLHLEHKGDFLVAPILTLNLGANNAGLYANLFFFNEQNNALEYVTADQISEDGTASLTFTHASDYVIIVDKEILANTAVHLDKPAETTVIEDTAEKADNPISNIADPNSMQAYVQTQPMEENKTPKSAAVARRIVAPEAKAGLRVFWILLILIAALVGVNTYLFMNREELKAAASSRASKKALSRSSSKAAAANGQKNLKKIQKANNKKFKKYL